jgi:hypothetical protein
VCLDYLGISLLGDGSRRLGQLRDQLASGAESGESYGLFLNPLGPDDPAVFTVVSNPRSRSPVRPHVSRFSSTSSPLQTPFFLTHRPIAAVSIDIPANERVFEESRSRAQLRVAG